MKYLIFVTKLIHRFQLILLITVFSLVLRILNPTFGSPILYVVPDEVGNYMSALYMMAERTPISLASQYPPLGAYIQIPFLLLAFAIMFLTGKFSNLSDLEFFLSTHEGYFLFIPRLISGLFGALTVPVVYTLSTHLFPKNKYVALYSTLIFSFSLTHIRLSHQGRPWTPAIFFFSLTLLFLVKSLQEPKAYIRLTRIATLFITIINGFFFQVGLIALYIFLLIRCYAYLIYRFNKKIINKKTLSIDMINILLIVVSALFFLRITSFKQTIPFLFAVKPHELVSISTFLHRLVYKNALIFFIKQLVTNEPLLVFGSIPFLFRKNSWRKCFFPLSLFVVSYIVIAGFIFYTVSRYLLPIIPILSVYSGHTLFKILKHIKWKFIRISFNISIILLLAFLPLLWLSRFLATPTFIQAKEWIEKEIKPSIPIASTSGRFWGFTPSLEAINIMQKYRPTAYQRAKKYLKQGEYPENVRNIIYIENITDSREVNDFKQVIKDLKIIFVINSYWNPHDRLLKKASNQFVLIKHLSPLSRNNRQFILSNMYGTMEPAPILLLSKIERAGPYIDVLKVKEI